MGESILERYRRQIEEDKNTVDDQYKDEYVKKLNELRNDENSMEKRYEKAMKKIHRITETALIEGNCLKQENIKEVKVLRAFCPECGRELVNRFPPMFNPFTQERQCIHECECGEKYNLDYSYPRIAFIGENGEEIIAHCE